MKRASLALRIESWFEMIFSQRKCSAAVVGLLDLLLGLYIRRRSLKRPFKRRLSLLYIVNYSGYIETCT